MPPRHGQQLARNHSESNLKKLIALTLVAALAGCTTTGGQINWQAQLAKACATSKPIVGVLDTLYVSGSLSTRNAQRYETAKVVYDQVCDGTVTDFATAAGKAAAIAVTLTLIAREEKGA